MDLSSTIPRMESVESSLEQRPRATQEAYMARVVPNNTFAFPPSMEVSVSDRTTKETKSSNCRGDQVE